MGVVLLYERLVRSALRSEYFDYINELTDRPDTRDRRGSSGSIKARWASSLIV